MSTPHIPADLLAREVQTICQRYRADPETARTALVEAFAAQPGLIEAIQTRHPAEDVTRLRAYKDAVKAARKQVYYQLRRYRREDARGADQETLRAQLAAQIAAGAPHEAIEASCQKLLRTHISTAERDHAAFYKTLFGLIETPASILDVGCGLQALAYPFDTAGTTHYVAIDRDATAIGTLRVFARWVKPARLVAIKADLTHFRWEQIEAPHRFDLALMLKLIPVVRRQDRAVLDLLANVPARRILITGNIEALARRERIRAREDKALRAFIAQSGRRVKSNFETTNEFGYIL